MSSVEGRRKHLFELQEKRNWMFLEDLLTARRWSKYITDDVVKVSSALSQRRSGRIEYSQKLIFFKITKKKRIFGNLSNLSEVAFATSQNLEYCF